MEKKLFVAVAEYDIQFDGNIECDVFMTMEEAKGWCHEKVADFMQQQIEDGHGDDLDIEDHMSNEHAPSKYVKYLYDDEYINVSVDEKTYDTAVFAFSVEEYCQSDVKSFSREMCEKLCNFDEENVTKYDESIETLLNCDEIDTVNFFVRVFE